MTRYGVTMDDMACYALDPELSRVNLLLFSTVIVYPIYILATILSYYQDGLGLKYVSGHLILIFSVEWAMRNFVLNQRPGYICHEKNKLTLWYCAGLLRVEYFPSRFRIIQSQKDEYLRIKIKKRILPLKVHRDKYFQFNEMPKTLDIIKIIKK